MYLYVRQSMQQPDVEPHQGSKGWERAMFRPDRMGQAEEAEDS